MCGKNVTSCILVAFFLLLNLIESSYTNEINKVFATSASKLPQKSPRAKASILPISKDAIHREWKQRSPFPSSLTKSTSKGKLRGIILGASLNRTVGAFLGVPYANPPTNNLRFKPPVEVSSWEGIRDATRQPPSCYQREDMFFADFEGVKEQQPRKKPSEDCLYLNIFVPNKPKRNQNEGSDIRADKKDGNLSVIVYIHGGGFHSGSSLPKKGSENGFRKSKWTPDPRELASEGNVIVVTIQYRLSSFGFIFLDDESAPGNVGLLDQYKALEWVRNEITHFGGNPSSITVMGQEAGGVSALIHYIQNPALFQRLILHSSGIQHSWSYIHPGEAFRRTLKLASLVGCPTSGKSRNDIIKCLIEIPADDIVNKEIGVAPPALNNSPFVITKDHNKFITMEPLKMILEKIGKNDHNFNDGSVLIGVNKDEGSRALMYYLPRMFPNRELDHEVISHELFDESISKIFDKSISVEAGKAVKFFYTNWTDPSNERQMFKSVQHLIGDYQTNCPVDYTSNLLSRHIPVYRYVFGAKNPLDVWPKWTGVKSNDEFDYIFGRPLHDATMLGNRTLYKEEDILISRFMMRSWSTFAKHGNPVGQSSSGTVGWPKYTENNRHILNIHGSQRSTDQTSSLGANIMWEPVSITTDNNEQTCAFWNTFLPDLKGRASDQCSFKKPRPKNRIKQNIFLPMKIRPRSTTTVNPKVSNDNIPERIHGIGIFSNSGVSMSNNEVIPRSRPSTSFISLNSLLQRDREYLELPSPIVISSPAVRQTTRSPIILTTAVLTTTQRTTTTTTTRRTTTTVTTTTTSKPATTTTTVMKSTTTTRMTTVTQSSHTMKRRPTVKFNPYIFVSSTMQSNRNRNVPKFRKEDVGGNALLNYTSETIERNTTSKSKHEPDLNNLEENGLVKINIAHDEKKADTLLTKQLLLLKDDVSFVPLTQSTNSIEDNDNLNEEDSNYDKNVTIEDDSLAKADSPFLIFGEQEKDSVLVKFRMSVGDKQTTSSLFPQSRVPSSTPKTTLHENKKYSIYKSTNPQDSAILVVNEVINANKSSLEIVPTKLERVLSSEIQSDSNLQVNIGTKHANTRYSQHNSDNTISKKTRRPERHRPYHRYPLPPVYDPFNTNTYLKSDHIKPRKTHSVEETNGRNKVNGYFRPRADDYFGTRKPNKGPISSSSKNDLTTKKNFSYFPI